MIVGAGSAQEFGCSRSRRQRVNRRRRVQDRLQLPAPNSRTRIPANTLWISEIDLVVHRSAFGCHKTE